MKYWQGYESHLRSKGLAYKKGGSSLPPPCVFSSPRVTARFEKQQRLTALHNLTDDGIGVAIDPVHKRMYVVSEQDQMLYVYEVHQKE